MYLPIIGMEIHVELRTKSKMFCGCPADHFGKSPNTQTCPVCLGLPGALPVPNKQAIISTYMIGRALNCRLNLCSKFDRKHYFYPDLPKGYQISQYDEPFCSKGEIKLDKETIRITRVHLEEDTGKLQHKTISGQRVTLIDFNRSGVALVEIVSEPDIHSSVEAKDYAQSIRNLINFLGVSDADMEKGSMRLEANISLQKEGQKELPNYKVEVKNINSFNFLKKAIDYEIIRQTNILELGQTPKQETRGFNEATGETVSQRSKEAAQDYRYFPEPDIPSFIFTLKEIESFLENMPLLPETYYRLFINTYHLRTDYARQLLEHRKLSEKALACLKLAVTQKLKPELVANYLINQKAQSQNQTPSQIVASVAKTQQKSNMSVAELASLAHEVTTANPELVVKYKSGKTNVLGALMGELIKKSHGQADPVMARQELIKVLGD